MGKRSLFVHAGLHKTGTTALQNALAQNPRWLAAHGYCFPLAGRPCQHCGQHNIAWEITRDRRFRADYGTAGDLLAEVRDGDYNVILSSEDFTGALANVSGFRDFVHALKDIFPDISAVLFLRNQVDYATSLYLELLAHGFDMTFESFLKEIATNGALRWREWHFPFDFQEFLSKIAEIGAVRLKICSYDANKDGTLVETFSKACEFPKQLIEPIKLCRENTRSSGGWYVAQFLRNRRGPAIDGAECLILDHLEKTWTNKRIGLSAEDHRFIKNTFRASNECVSGFYAVPINEFMDIGSRDSKDSGSVTMTMSSLFSIELQELFADLSIKLKAEMESANASREALASERHAMETERDRLRAEVNEAVAVIDILRKQSISLSMDADAARAERDRLAMELHVVSAARDAVALERDSIIDSRSWKLTAPLRRAMHLLNL